MSEKRFELDVRLDMPKLLIDNATNKRYHLLLVNDIEEIVDLLNELAEENRELRKELGDCEKFRYTVFKRLNEENEQLQAQLREKEEDERLYANEILELRETNKEHIKFKSLGGNY